MRPRKPEPDSALSDAVGQSLHHTDDLGAEDALRAGGETPHGSCATLDEGHEEKSLSQDASVHSMPPGAGAAAAPAASIAAVSRPLCGVWSSSALRRLPRFPDRDSFPLAKALIEQFLEGAFSEGDLRIALFWLGFALLGSVSSEEPAVNLVPLCKDLDTYTDIALELGYDPEMSVHNRPVLPHTAELDKCVAQLCGSCSGGSSSSSTACAPEAVILEGRRGSGKDSECCGFHPAPRSSGAPVPRATASSSSGLLCAAEEQRSLSDGDSSLMAVLAAETVENEDDGYYGSKGSGKGGLSSAFGAQSSSSAHPPLSTTLDAMLAAELGAQQVLSYKVKLTYSGGWASSDNSSSEGQRTPPQPGTGSRGAGTSSSSSAGLDACYVDQFTVSYISDLGEGLEEIAEPTGSAEPVEPVDDPEPAGLCAFCLDDMRFGELLCRLPCMHTFHQRCVHEWLKRDRRCMLCRSDITMPRGSTCC